MKTWKHWRTRLKGTLESGMASHAHKLKRLNEKMAVLPKAVYRADVFIKVPRQPFTKVGKKNLKIHMETQKCLNSQRNSEQEYCWRYHHTGFQVMLQSQITKNSMDQHKSRHLDQWTRIKDSNINPDNYSHLIFEKDTKNTCLRKDSPFSKWCWESLVSTWRGTKLGPCLSLCTKIDSKWINDFVKTWNSEIFGGQGGTLQDTGREKSFLYRVPVAQEVRPTVNKRDLVKWKSLRPVGGTMNWIKSLQNGRKSFAGCTFDRAFISRLYRN